MTGTVWSNRQQAFKSELRPSRLGGYRKAGGGGEQEKKESAAFTFVSNLCRVASKQGSKPCLRGPFPLLPRRIRLGGKP